MIPNSPLYHGTSFDIKDQVRTGKAVGHSHFGDVGSDLGQPSKNHAFATTDESIGWHFASNSASEAQQRARVYEVHPHPNMLAGAHDFLKEYIAPSLGIKRQIDTMPPVYGQTHRQGTIPNINWRQFSVSSGGPGDHINHPDHYEQRYGHPGSNLRREQNEANATHGAALSENADRSGPPKGQMMLPGMIGYTQAHKTPVHEILDLL